MTDKPEKEPPKPDDPRIAKAQRDLDRTRKSQSWKAAGGAVAGGITAEAIALGGLVFKFVGEMSFHANKSGFSILEVKDNQRVMSRLTALASSHPESIARLKPYLLATVAAPFVGAAVGAWALTAYGTRSIRKQRESLEKLVAHKEDTAPHWQAKIEDKRAEHDAKTVTGEARS